MTTDIKAALNRIRQQLMERPALLSGHGVMVDDPAYSREAAIYEKIRSQLSLLLREIRNESNLLMVRTQSVRTLPRPNRYSAAASLNSRLAETDELSKIANDLLQLLNKLAQQNASPGLGDMAANQLQELQDEYHQEHHSMQIQLDPRGIIVAPVNGSLGLEQMVVLSVIILQGILRKRRGPNRD